jgi:hypothetical protein
MTIDDTQQRRPDVAHAHGEMSFTPAANRGNSNSNNNDYSFNAEG